MKIGRNAPCPCGSGKKYKRCHGADADQDTRTTLEIRQSDFDQMRNELMAQEKQREMQQGRGRRIISGESKGFRFVAVGGQIFYSNKWRTFHDFLYEYIWKVLNPFWGKAELKKPYEKRHPILQWYKFLCDIRQAHAKEPGQITNGPMIGAVAAYLHLAYNLYLLGHNAELQNWLIKRLKKNENFTGAYYETFVAAAFIKAGFKLDFENERDSQTKHCEFTATYPETGVKFSVEAKDRETGKCHADVSKQLYKALKKDARHTRIIFIEMNLEDAGPCSAPIPYQQEVTDCLRACESGRIGEKEAPPAYVIVTNFPYHHSLESTSYRWSAIGEGFKIPDFKADYQFSSIREWRALEEKHYEIYQLLDAMREYTNVPSTFDGEIPEFAFGEVERPRLIIGHKYVVPLKDGQDIGVLQDACVDEPNKMIYGVYRLENGRCIIAASTMTEEEIHVYREYPDTFFGVNKDPVRQISNPIDAYKWLKEAYKVTPKKKLIELVQWPEDKEKLKDMSREELLELFCERMAINMWQLANKK